jgi:hypothetical protein
MAKQTKTKKESPGRLFYTDEGVNVNSRIKKGTTKAFCSSEREAARIHADSIRSYVYDLFNDKSKFCGYAVPN